jgi:hypothetical protein
MRTEIAAFRRPGGQRGTALVLAACTAAALPLTACSGPGSPAQSATAVSTTCAQVSAVLADGPDPDRNPAGYAEAQIVPLRQLHSSDPALRAAISKLAGAYSRFFAAGGTSAVAAGAVTTAARQLDRLCPGATA